MSGPDGADRPDDVARGPVVGGPQDPAAGPGDAGAGSPTLGSAPDPSGDAPGGTGDPGQGARVIEQRGLYFEEFEVGTVYRHAPGRTVTEADNTFFTALTMNTQSLHLDAAWSARQPFGRRLVNSMFTLATLVGASVAQLTQGTIVANLGFEEVAFPHPLYHGDTLYSESEVLSKRESSSRPGQGIVRVRHVGRNQDGVEVARCVRSVMVWLKEEAPR